MLFNFVTNTMAALSLGSTALEAGKMGVKKAKANARTEVAIKDIRDYSGDAVLNKESEKYDAMKQIVRDGDVSVGLYSVKGALTGFFEGAWNGLKDNFVSAGFAILTLVAKSKTVKTIGAIGCGLATAWDFIANGTNLFANKDTIEK